MFDVDEELDHDGQVNFVLVWGDGSLDELQILIDHYRRLGFDRVWHGDQNSTLCIQKTKEK